MTDPADLGPADLGTAEAARRIAAGELTSEALVTACLARVNAREPQVEDRAVVHPAFRRTRPDGAAGKAHRNKR